jgi:hypothetical protein
MEIKIEAFIRDLIGQTLTETSRASNMECLKFGIKLREDRNGKKFNVGLFAIHLQCPWRITKENKILIGSADLFEPSNPKTKNFNWETKNLRDKKLSLLITQNISIIEIRIDQFGGFGLEFNDGTKMSVFPDCTAKDNREYWRIIDNRKTKTKHFVSWSDGFEID